MTSTTRVGSNSHLMGIKHQQKLTVHNAPKKVKVGQNVKSLTKNFPVIVPLLSVECFN